MNMNGMKTKQTSAPSRRGVRPCGRSVVRRNASMQGLARWGGVVSFLVLSAADVQAATSYWDPQINIYSNTTELGMAAADSGFKGTYNIGTTFNIKRAGINAWSDNNMWWNDTYFYYRVYGQDRNPSEASANLPRTGGNGNDHYFGWNTDLNLNMKAGITYNGTYMIAYRYSFKDNDGDHYTGYYYPTFTVVGTNYIVTNGTGSVNQNAFNGGASPLVGTGCKLVMQGANTLTLNAGNTFSGNTYIDRGTVSISHNGGAGNGAIFQGAEGGTDAATLYLTGGRTVTNNVTVRSGSSGAMTLGSTDVSSDNVFQGSVTLNKAATVTAASQGTVTLGGVVSGGNALSKQGTGIVVLTNNNTFSGGLNVWAGTVQLDTHTNAMGGGTVNVGTNATLDLAYGSTTIRPATLNLYGTGTNSMWGALRMSSAGSLTWPVSIVLGADSRIAITAGGLLIRNTIAAGSYTLYVTNDAAFTMSTSSSMTGSKTTGDGALHKSGTSQLFLRPASGLTGSITLEQGEIRQGPGSALPSGGTLSMADGTTYSSDGGTTRTIGKALVINGDVGLAENSTGGLEFTGTVSLGSGMRAITHKNDVSISGVISSGGLEKKGGGTLTLSGANTYASGTLVSAGTLEGTTTSLQGNITNNAAVVMNQGGHGTYAGVLSGTGTLTKQGAGTVTLSGTSGMSGNTTISAGALLVSGSLGSSAVTVSSGATLAGAGTVGAITSLAGTISPGNSAGAAGTLTVSGAAALGGGTYTCDIKSTTSTDCDKIAASGAVAAASALTINLGTSAPSGFSECNAYTWTIMSGSSANAANMSIGTKWTTTGSFGVSVSGNTIVVTHTPAAPGKPTVAASDGTSTAHVALSWGDVTCETGYVILRNTVDNYGTATALYTNAANTTTYNDTTANPGQLYYYWVVSTNVGGSTASDSNSGYKRLSPPGNVAATDGSSTANVTVTWDAATGATGYHVWRDTDADPSGATGLGAQSSGFADTPTPGQLYYYWVVASNSTSSSTSDLSTANSGYRKLPTVAGVAATENLSDKVTVTWTDSDAGETGYTVWRSDDSDSGNAAIVSGAALAAAAVSYDDTTATAGQTYYYWVRATNSTSASMSDFGSSDTGMKTLAEPTTAASAITFSSLDTTSYTVGWTRGDGDYVLVVARQGSAPADPTDTTVYTADAAFGSGQTTAAGSYVVYKGTGTSVPVTALSAGTEYYFAVYEFNGATTPNYRTSDAPVSNRYTLVAEPTTQASGLAISAPLEVSMSGFSWTDGNGSSRILVAKAGSAVDGFPADGTAYSYSTNFGSGSQIGAGNYVVWIGAGQPDRISSLTRDVVYHFRLFEFNGSATTVNYNTNAAAGNPISQTTLAAKPTTPVASDLSASPIGTTTATLNWTLGDGTYALVVMKADTSGVSDPTVGATYTANAAFGSGDATGAGSYVVYKGSGTSVPVTNLDPGRRYYFAVYMYNGSSPGAENYRTSDEPKTDFYTLMPEPTQATGIGFGTLDSASYAVSYTAGNGLSRLVVAKAGSAVTFLPTDGTAYSGENNTIGSATDLGAGNFLVHRGTSPFTLSGLTAATDYHVRIFEYQGTNATLNYNTNVASGNPANRYTLSTEPSAHAATFTATAASDTGIDLTWGAATGESGFIIVRKVGSAPTGTPADGTAYAQGNAIGDGTVVYVNTTAGAGSTTDSYSTSADTAYYYQIFPYAYDGTPANATYNYRTAATIPGTNATTGSSEPGASSTVTSFLPASGSSATLIWDNSGSADGTIILVKSGAAVDANPADWSGYSASTVFTSGDQIGTGNYVVYAAAGKSGSVTITGLSAGTTYHAAVYPYNGSGTFLNYRTTSPGTANVTILPDPSAATATVDGKTLIDLAWTKHASYDVMIVHKSGSASTLPTQGTAYSVGDTCGGGKVIHKGGGAALEHVVASGTAHYYAFYSYSGNYYSAGITDNDSTTSFATDEIVETFSYTNNTTLTGLNGETGWGGAWYGDTGSATNHAGSFSEQTNYPAPSGNKLFMHPADNSSLVVYRPLGQDYKTGQIYFSYIMNYQWDGATKWAGLSLMWSNTTEKLFIGEIGTADKTLGIDTTASSPTYTLTNGTGNDYIIVGYYDWDNGEAKAKAYKIGAQAVPVNKPSTWDVNISKSSNDVGWVNGIRLGAGATSGRPGDIYFDEVRIATNWAGIVQVLPTKPEWPTNQTATVDGKEMVRLGWTKNANSDNVMILHKTAAITTDPTDGTGYSTGNTIDGATVIAKTAATALEHVVTPGTTNYYKFYSYIAANYYSTGIVTNVTTTTYGANENVNPFSYTNATSLGTSTKGGQGFGANFWAVDSGTWTAKTNYSTAVTDDTPKFFNMTGYPDMAGNLVVASDPGNNSSALAQRSLGSSISTGTFYVAFMMSYQYYGSNKWAGLSLFNGATEKAFFGKGGGANWSTLGLGDGTTTFWSAYDMGQFNSGNGNTGNVYMVLGKYDFSSRELAAKAYRILDGHTFPASEPTWDVTTTLGTGIDSIDRIKLNIGSSDTGATIGKVFYDEVRFATNWSDLLAVTCPTWAGSNELNAAAWSAPAGTWLGDSENFTFQSYPISAGQSGGIEFDWARDGTFATYQDLPWLQNANNNSYWSNRIQMVTAGVITSRYVAAGGACAKILTNNPALTVQNLNAPSNAVATRDAVNTNSQINLTWVRGVSGVAKDTLIIRRGGAAPASGPVNGTTYNPGDPLGGGTVIYRGSGTSFNDTGLAPSTTYTYHFYSENWSYYSTYNDREVASASTVAGAKAIVIDGNPVDWVGTPSTVFNSSASTLQEFIWTDKTGEMRTDQTSFSNADITEFRVYADTDWVYFLIEMGNITDVTNLHMAIGIDTRTSAASTGMNWLGDDGATFIGDQYFDGGAAHYPENQLGIHYVTAEGGLRIEQYVEGGTAWFAPPTGGNTNVAASTTHNAIELRVARADLNLSGAKTARFTLASFLNTGAWNNDGDGTVLMSDNTANAVDSVSIPPWGNPDNNADMSSWLEDLSDADIDFWVDIDFGAASLTENSRPTTPVLVSPTNNAATTSSPNLIWNASTDADGEVTGYLLEISTNEQFNGVTGTENGPIQLRVHLDATTTNYLYATTATQYWWRVRARDTAGMLSTATTHVFRVVGKLDTQGPQPTLLYIGTNVAGYLAGDTNILNHIAKYGPIQSVLDSEISDTNNVFGFVLRWEDPSGVYATNRNWDTGGFAYNIIDTDGRVTPNWDLVEIDTVNNTTNDLWGVDKPFYATNTLATGNSDAVMTNYVQAAFNVTNYDPTIEYYLTVSAEDAYTEGGSWWAYGSWPSFTNSAAAIPYYSGWCADGPNTARNITTNYLIRIQVTDDDIVPPSPSQALGWVNNGTNAMLVVSNAAGRLDYVAGEGQEVLYQITDGALIGEPLSFSFNAYDSYYLGIALGTNETYIDKSRTLTNTAFVAAYWQTNWANYDASRSVVTDTTSADTMLTWHWPSITTQDVTKLWGPTSLDGELGVTNLIQLDLYDIDNDRDGDQASARHNFGRIVLVDDDAVDPVVVPETLSVTGTGLAREYVLSNLVNWDFLNGLSSLTSTNVASNMTASAISHGGVGGTVNLRTASGVPEPMALYSGAPYYNTNYFRYLQFTLEPTTTTKTFKANSISFDSRVTTLNGPDTIELWGTMPGGAEELWASTTVDLSDPDNPIGTNWNGYSMGVNMSLASTGTVTFKLLARVADTNHLVADANANWYIDNLIVSGYVLGEAGGTQITDYDLAHGTVKFSLQAKDVYSGIDGTIGATGRAPRVDFWKDTGGYDVLPITNAFVTNNWSAATNTLLDLWGTAPAADKKQIALGAGGASLAYYARFTATDADVDRHGDWRSVSYMTTNTVYDDDSSRPARGYLYGGPLGVFVDGVLTKAVSSGNNREYRINDEQLQTASATSITVKVNLYDYSGWTVPTLSFSNATAGVMSTNPWLTAVHTDSVDTTNKPEAAMEWQFAQSQANTLFDSYESVVSEFRIVSVWDKDDDRQDGSGNNIDNLELADARIGYLTFIDNDVGAANVQSSYSAARTNWNIPKVYLGLPGDPAASNTLINAATVLDTNVGTVALTDLTNRVYDSQLAKVSAAAPLSVVLPVYDTGGGGSGRTVKGVQRGTTLTEVSPNGGYNITNSSISIGSVTTNNAANYRADLSSPLPLTRIAAQFPTSTWTFTSFSYSDVGDWLPTNEVARDHVMTADIYDADDNRPEDQKANLGVALGTLRVLDNDTVAPTAPTNVKVNGQAMAGPLTRATAAWTNDPHFIVSFKPSVDGEPTGTDLEKTGIGEHRSATDKSDIGPDSGTPLAVPAESSLANYGFESGATHWTLTGAQVSTEQAYEGTHSLKMTASTAIQTVALVNTNGYVPRVTVVGAQYMGATDGTLTVDGLDTNGVLVAGQTFNVVITGSAGAWVGNSSGATSLDSSVDQVRVTLTSGAGTYWDDIHVQIELLDGGSPVEDVTSLFTATEQGLVTNYLFAVDRDNNRPGDRMASSAPADPDIPAFGTAYDITPPTPVPDVLASTEDVGDPTTQFDISWEPNKVNFQVGPDNPGDTNHPTGTSTDRDILSPWRTYKIYYGTFNSLDVPGGDPGPGSGDAYIYTNYITTGDYLSWSNVISSSTIVDPSVSGTNYLALTNLNQSAIRLFDLDFDQDYAVIVVGVDKAGNEGSASASSWATNNTIKFSVTQGTLRAFAQAPSFPAEGGTTNFSPWAAPNQQAAALYWIAAGPTNAQGNYTQVTKDYDLIYYNAGSFQESTNWTWIKSGTVRTNWFVETNAFNLPRGTLQFYRASYKDRWRRTNVLSGLKQRPLASEEVYALHNVLLSEGVNYVGLHGQPYTNTFAGVFGTDTNIWPAGPSAAAGATRIEFFVAGTNPVASDTYFFGSDANWYKDTPLTKVTTNLQASNFFTRGFSITLPTNLTARGYATTNAWDFDKNTNVAALVWHPILQVPTNGVMTHTIACGLSEQRTNVLAYTVVALNLPVSVHPSALNFPTNFTRGVVGQADMIYTWDTATKGVRNNSHIYCKTNNQWYFSESGNLVPPNYFKPNDVIVIVSKNGGVGNTWQWSYHPTNFYNLPTRWMGE